MNQSETRAYWDSQADAFDSEADHGLTHPETRSAWWEVMQDLLPNAPARVADLGCGTGSLSVLVAEHGYDVTGIDLSPAMILNAANKAHAHRLSIDFAVDDASHPNLDAGSFDVVLARHVVWALPDPSAALAGWTRLLQPEGRLVLIEGRRSTDVGLAAAELRTLVEPMARAVEIRHLRSAALWGHTIGDERYALVAHV
jgi:ubiquinone/menaquinone biosynthesis C-methylase UbiE